MPMPPAMDARTTATPNIDRLAAEGMKFMQAYANSAVCSATRTALITGRYQYRLPVGLEEPIRAAQSRIAARSSHAAIAVEKGRLRHYSRSANGTSDSFPTTARSRAATTISGASAAAASTTSRTNPAPANSDTGDLWDGDVKIEQSGYMTDLIGDQAVASVNAYAKANDTVPHQPSFQRAALALGRP